MKYMLTLKEAFPLYSLQKAITAIAARMADPKVTRLVAPSLAILLDESLRVPLPVPEYSSAQKSS